jgi:hypothetical protein
VKCNDMATMHFTLGLAYVEELLYGF